MYLNGKEMAAPMVIKTLKVINLNHPYPLCLQIKKAFFKSYITMLSNFTKNSHEQPISIMFKILTSGNVTSFGGSF